MTGVEMAKASRSQFVEKLHALLETPFDRDSLRWTNEPGSPGAFEITCDDRLARNALSPSWEFRSLSSFIRQLSYYNFKRLSDRRRSSERRSVASGFIKFHHPTGLFVPGNSTAFHGISRKTRNRPEKSGDRRASTSSVHSSLEDDHEPPPPMPQPVWPADHRTLGGFQDDRRQSYPPPQTQPFQPPFPSARHTDAQHEAPYRGFQSQSHPAKWDSIDRPQTHHRHEFDNPPLSPRSNFKRADFHEPSQARPPPPLPRKLSIHPTHHNEVDYRADTTYRSPKFPTFSEGRQGPDAVPSGLPIPYDEAAQRPTYAPVLNYSPYAGSSNQPLPSPTGSAYSSCSDAGAQNHLPPFNPGPNRDGSANQHFDPRGPANSRQPPPPNQYFNHAAGHMPGWAASPPNPPHHRASTGDTFSNYQPPAILSPRR